ncbi:MAG: Ig-like domain-containing protein [Chitinophagaceae bacterium]|nr:Ig-like domain-containing protein [Chitinophagaceae bacterium]
MNKKTSLLLLALLFITINFLLISCANIIPPGGGPRDSLPPQLMQALPKNFSTQFSSNKIVLSFNEYIELKEITKSLIVSPLPKNQPSVDYKLKTITIKLKDSLIPNTTYSINFGNSIVDINEGNPLSNFTYVYSTGSTIDSCQLKGKVILAENGKTDSTLIAVLYSNLSDTAVITQKPLYITQLKGDGSFTFKHIPPGIYALYAMPNDYAKRYNDSTKLFAFTDSAINVNYSNINSTTLYAFQEAKNNQSTPVASNNNIKNNNKAKHLKYTSTVEFEKQDILNSTLELLFTSSINKLNTSKILLADTNFNAYNNYTIALDSVTNKIIVTTPWLANTAYKLLIFKDAVYDKQGNTIAQNDTLNFLTKKETDYGALKLRFNNLDTLKNPVLLIYQQTNLVEAIKINKTIISRKLFKPGDFDLKILYDKNNNGIWNTGNYKNKLQPEIVVPLDKKLSIRANWDNEAEINIK